MTRTKFRKGDTVKLTDKYTVETVSPDGLVEIRNSDNKFQWVRENVLEFVRSPVKFGDKVKIPGRYGEEIFVVVRVIENIATLFSEEADIFDMHVREMEIQDE